MPTEVPTSEFSTTNLYLAAWLLCSRAAYRKHSLSFLRVGSSQTGSSGKLFIFSDPCAEGPALEGEFKGNPVVRILSLRNALNFLRDQINAENPYPNRPSGGAR
jgi:hypothetical protein